MEVPIGENPATLVAILVAARRVGNRELERQARRKLKNEFGIALHFASEGKRMEGNSDD